jgi:hypothetical protein
MIMVGYFAIQNKTDHEDSGHHSANLIAEIVDCQCHVSWLLQYEWYTPRNKIHARKSVQK